MNYDFLKILPPNIARSLRESDIETAEELRLRVGQVPTVIRGCREFVLPGLEKIIPEDLQSILRAATKGSAYAVNEEISQGFVTLPGGHRLGLCGTGVSENGRIQTYKNISSVNLRLAKEFPSLGILLKDSTLIAGPPGCGKTTLLRGCIARISDFGQRVGLVDSRGEIAACVGGTPQFSIGCRTDVISGVDKHTAVLQLLKTMSPQWIAVDEITDEKDAAAVGSAFYCGAKILATVHLEDEKDIFKRPIYRHLWKLGAFKEILLMKNDHSYLRTKPGDEK